jgi:hypothetical protein
LAKFLFCSALGGSCPGPARPPCRGSVPSLRSFLLAELTANTPQAGSLGGRRYFGITLGSPPGVIGGTALSRACGLDCAPPAGGGRSERLKLKNMQPPRPLGSELVRPEYLRHLKHDLAWRPSKRFLPRPRRRRHFGQGTNRPIRGPVTWSRTQYAAADFHDVPRRQVCIDRLKCHNEFRKCAPAIGSHATIEIVAFSSHPVWRLNSCLANEAPVKLEQILRACERQKFNYGAL